ncbi:MAG: hypothetical protein ACQEP2_06825, partial [Actinomycetota bacterium]
MKSKPNIELEEFAYRFLESRGAVLEKNKQGFEALMPRNLSEDLGTSEHIHIGNGKSPETEGAYSINYGSLILEKMVETACRETPLLACQFQADYLKKEGFDRLINEHFVFSNTVGKIENKAETKTSYIFLTCRYTAQSDEQKHGLINLVFNLETGACIPGMADLMFAPGNNFIPAKRYVLNDGQLEKITKCIKQHTELILMEELKTFYESMVRRFKRDASNLEEYYSALEKEMKKNLKKRSPSKELAEERRKKISLLPAELERKRSDLFKKYSIRVNIEPCAAMVINTLAVTVIYNLSIGKKRESVSFTYNPV